MYVSRNYNVHKYAKDIQVHKGVSAVASDVPHPFVRKWYVSLSVGYFNSF
jgi:hypothetical protein